MWTDCRDTIRGFHYTWVWRVEGKEQLLEPGRKEMHIERAMLGAVTFSQASQLARRRPYRDGGARGINILTSFSSLPLISLGLPIAWTDRKPENQRTGSLLWLSVQVSFTWQRNGRIGDLKGPRGIIWQRGILIFIQGWLSKELQTVFNFLMCDISPSCM